MTADELAGLSERAARVITSGGGLKALAQLLADSARGSVLVEDDQWRYLAAASWRAAKTGGVKPSGVKSADMKSTATTPASFAPYYKKGKNSIVHAQLGDSVHALCAPMPSGGGENGEPAGYVTLFLRAKVPSDATAALRIVASAAGVECVRRGAGRAQQRRAFWERFLNGDFADVAAARDEALQTGVALPPAYVAAAFDVEGASPHDALDAVGAAVGSAAGFCPLALPGGIVVALFPVRNFGDVARARQAAANAVRDLPAAGAARSVSCGIGSHHSDLLETPRSLHEARHALSVGRRLFGRGAVTVHGDLGIFALLDSGADRESFVRFADALIEPLAAYDRKHKTDLLKTLRLYIECGENVKEAAEKLSVHRHTIFYRLNQISQILRMELRSPKDQLNVRAALAIRQMREADQ